MFTIYIHYGIHRETLSFFFLNTKFNYVKKKLKYRVYKNMIVENTE